MKKIMKKLILILLIVNCSLQIANTQWRDAYITDFKVNDDNLNSYQTNSRIGVDSIGNFVIVWSDARNNPGQTFPIQVYCQRYNKNGLNTAFEI